MLLGIAISFIRMKTWLGFLVLEKKSLDLGLGEATKAARIVTLLGILGFGFHSHLYAAFHGVLFLKIINIKPKTLPSLPLAWLRQTELSNSVFFFF